MTLVTSQHSDAAGHRPTLAPVPAPSSSEDDLTDWIEVSMFEFKALKRSLAGVLRRLSAGCRAVAEAESRFAAMNGHAVRKRQSRQLGLNILGTYNESFQVEHQILEALEEYLDCLDDDEMLSRETWNSLVPGLDTLEDLRETLAIERLVLTQCGR